MSHLFYLPDLAEGMVSMTMPPEEAFHCLKVLRMQRGDRVLLTNGKGEIFTGELQNQDGRKLKVGVLSVERVPSPSKKVAIAVAPTKSNDRFEWFIEKATELGVTDIFPIITAHSERKKLNFNRVQKVAAAALKQSQRAYLPNVHPLQPYEQFMEKCGTSWQRFLAIVAEKDRHLLKKAQPLQDGLVLIGPEGGFAETEMAAALRQGFVPVSLGNNRLRTETAALAAVQILMSVEILH